MSDNYFRRSDGTPDSLDEFLAQLIADLPEIPSFPTIFPPPPSASASSSSSAGSQIPVTQPHNTCQWVTQHHPLVMCGSILPTDHKDACAHFRQVHQVRGNEKVPVSCEWHECRAPQMLRGSLVRHVLSVHLGLLRWRCEVCGKWFSRRGTIHACVDAAE